MGKGKKGGKRMNKAQLTEKLQEFFASQPGVTLSFKEIFRGLHLTTHPLKMLAIDIMEEMAWDDYLAKVSDNSYRLNQSVQVMEGKFVRKSNGKNSVIPDGSEKPIFVSERNSMGALNGDRVEFTFLARRKNHIKEAQVNKILERAKDSFVGRLKVDKDIAYLVTPGDVFAHNIIIPRRKLKGGKTDDKAVVRIIEWPDGENKSPIGEVVDVLGQTGDNDVEMNTILAQYGLPYKYPKNVEDAANKITGEITEQDYKEREDFRQVFTCTIDPKDAKDFDDHREQGRRQQGREPDDCRTVCCYRQGLHRPLQAACQGGIQLPRRRDSRTCRGRLPGRSRSHAAGSRCDERSREAAWLGRRMVLACLRFLRQQDRQQRE